MYNRNQNKTIGTISVKYINLLPVDTRNYNFPSDTLDGPIGNHFNVSQYVKHVPAGYHFVKILGGRNVTTFQPNDQVVIIGIAPNHSQVNQPSLSAMTIDYQSVSGRQLNHTIVRQAAGSRFSIKPYTQMLPMGYRFVYTKNVPRTYTDGAHMTIVVKPLDKSGTSRRPQQHRSGNVNNAFRSGATRAERTRTRRPRPDRHSAVNHRARQVRQESGTMTRDDYLNGKFDNHVDSDVKPQHADVVQRHDQSDRMVNTDDDRELVAIGSILNMIGKGLSKLGLVLEHRHSPKRFKR